MLEGDGEFVAGGVTVGDAGIDGDGACFLSSEWNHDGKLFLPVTNTNIAMRVPMAVRVTGTG